MRLTPQTEDYLALYQGDSLVYQRPIMDFLSRVEEYRTQEGLDREDAYLIELLFECEHPGDEPDRPDPDPDPDRPGPRPDPTPEWGALISFRVNGWNFIDREIDI